MDVGSAVVADEQSFELVKPGERALDDPAVAAQAGAVCGVAPRDLGPDPALAELAATTVVVIGAVGADTFRSPPWPADLAAHQWNTIDKKDQLGAVVAVAAGERPGERDAATLNEEVVL